MSKINLSARIEFMEKDPIMYEIGYLLSPLIPEEKLDEEISDLRKLIEGGQGLIINESRAKIQKLSYPIKKHGSPAGGYTTAYFGWIKFFGSPESLAEIKNSLGKNDKIIRFLITKTTKESLAPKMTKKIIKKRTVAPKEKKKTEIKIEEIDKKIEELIGHESK